MKRKIKEITKQFTNDLRTTYVGRTPVVLTGHLPAKRQDTESHSCERPSSGRVLGTNHYRRVPVLSSRRLRTTTFEPVHRPEEIRSSRVEISLIVVVEGHSYFVLFCIYSVAQVGDLVSTTTLYMCLEKVINYCRCD